MVSSVLNEGIRGLQTSQREIGRAASEIARAGVRTDAVATETVERDPTTTIQPVEQTARSESTRDLAEPLVELRRQEQIFNASAKVVSTADETLGNLLDTKA